jgi:putative ATP-dependent endonuclease of the OLD family
MKLVGFSIKNYRSISKAYKLPLSDFSVIVGPNNEGKSNILKGLALALLLLSGSKQQRFRRTGGYVNRNRAIQRFDYNWERDFPINLQIFEPNGKSEFTCEFELNEDELIDFKIATKINLNTNLKSKILIDRTENITFDFLMKGKGKKALNSKRHEISQFINERLLLQYIPAIRTSELAINIVENLLERELSKLEDNPAFQQLIDEIVKLQQPIINRITRNLKKSISDFIPDVKGIKIKNSENVGSLISASCNVFIDDGTETDLQLKGDGVISLTAISLLQYFSKQGSLNKGLILLLEEPECHLHPKAIHSLKTALHEISKSNQVILTTHSPIIIDRINVQHNIIVAKGEANPAKSINDIRRSLGITMSDNLSSAFLVVLVEGEEDIIVLKAWLESISLKIQIAIENSILIFDHLGGASNIGYKASLYKNNLCNIIAFLDDDESGRKGVADAESKGILRPNEYIVCNCSGRRNSEIEDLIEFEAYYQLILDNYGVDLKTRSFKNNNLPWSNRVKHVFQQHGKVWSTHLESEIKYKVATKAAQLKKSSLNAHKSNSINSLVSVIENIILKQK